MKDIFDSELNFVQHCKEKINTAYLYLGITKKNFIFRRRRFCYAL